MTKFDLESYFECFFSEYIHFSLNRHLSKSDSDLELVLSFPYSYIYLTLCMTDITLRQTLVAGPNCVCLRETELTVLISYLFPRIQVGYLNSQHSEHPPKNCPGMY